MRPLASPVRELRATAALQAVGCLVAVVLVVVLMALLVPGVAGVLLGNAVALGLMAREMRDWQRREGSLLLREPRYRTDALDFYRADLRG